jgi:phage pi2 protein 07
VVVMMMMMVMIVMVMRMMMMMMMVMMMMDDDGGWVFYPSWRGCRSSTEMGRIGRVVGEGGGGQE